jgi:hypothetical protein
MTRARQADIASVPRQSSGSSCHLWNGRRREALATNWRERGYLVRAQRVDFVRGTAWGQAERV